MAKTRITMGVVGQIASSMLTEAQFQSINGPSWVLMDGRSIAGSAYATLTGSSTIPDARGMVLRGKNNGRSDGNQNPAADRSLGEYEGDQMQGHMHQQQVNISVGSSNTQDGSILGCGSGGAQAKSYVNYYTNTPSSDGTNGVPRTGLETRTKNITVNHFIKIN
jgi:hypothetical protein